MSFSRVPAIVLTGFLGSGKTSLLNRLMRTRPERGARWAIVVNELGEIGIDGDLLPGDMTRQVELPGGCICCVLNEDLDATLLELLDGAPDLEMILIETTGVAEPLPIAWSLARAPVSDRVRLAAVVTVVDALNFTGSRHLGVAVDAQVQYADILVVSKMDQLPPPPAAAADAADRLPEALASALDELNPEALRIAGAPSEIAEFLWKTLDDPLAAEQPTVRARGGRAEPPPHDGHAHDGHAHGNAGGGHGLDTIWVPIDQTIDFEELTERLEALPASYVRIKGIARVVDGSTGSTEPHLVAFHRVGTRVSSEPIGGSPAPRVVALGTGMDPARLAACVSASVVTCPG